MDGGPNAILKFKKFKDNERTVCDLGFKNLRITDEPYAILNFKKI